MSFLFPGIPPPLPLPLPLHASRSQTALALPRISPPRPAPLEPAPPGAGGALRDRPAPPTGASHGHGVKQKKGGEKDEFYLNLGQAVRTLRNDLPALFARDLDYSIYREDITFIDPLNTFKGIENYKLIFWALRFHGRLLFKEIGLEVYRVWQPSETMILIRWELKGIPRVPWEAYGQFQGTSRYKVDRNGKIYEHKVDNLAFNFPRVVHPGTVLDLVAATCPASPNLTFQLDAAERDSMGACSWVELYRKVRQTLEQEGQGITGSGLEGLVALNGLVTCS